MTADDRAGPSPIEAAATSDAVVVAAYCQFYRAFKQDRDPVVAFREALALAVRQAEAACGGKQ